MKTTKECYMENDRSCYFAKDGECTAPKDWDCSVLEDMNVTEIPFGTDSELVEETITIPEGCSVWIINDKIVIIKGNFVKKKEATGVLKKLLDETKHEREFIDKFTAYMYHPNTDPDIILACCKKLLSIAKEHFDKDMQEALRTEYEKGRADAIQATEQWLANSWPKYCENPNIIYDYKEAIK